VTKSRRCRWCGRPVEVGPGPGRPRQFCRASCRQRDYEARLRAHAHGLDDSEIIMRRRELDDLHDALFVLRCAVQDVDRDLQPAHRQTKQDHVEAVAWLLEAARPLLALAGERP
jgi:hypothetical protein